MGALQSLVSAFFKTPLLKLWMEVSRAALSLELLTVAAGCGCGGGGGGGAGVDTTAWLAEAPTDSLGKGGGAGIVGLLSWDILSSAKM